MENSIIQPAKSDVTYSSYLKVMDLIGLQQTVSLPAARDEMLFIVIHQVYELWFKQIIFEIERSATDLELNQVLSFKRSLDRIATIQGILNQQVDILETMPPNEFNRFRNNLNPASGFQSHQFRMIEILLGHKNTGYLKFFVNQPEAYQQVERALKTPSVYDRFLRLLGRKGFAIPDDVLQRDVRQQYEGDERVQAELVKIYQYPNKNYDIYTALEALIEVDEKILLWRYRHVAMVERMIGGMRGTGGSSGAKYLSSTLTKRFFPDLWQIRNQLGALSSDGYGSQSDTNVG